MNKKAELRKLSKKADRIGKILGYKRQSYNDLQKTEIWRTAKVILLDYVTNNGKKPIICCFCNKPIEKRSKAVLHHKDYNWSDLFNPKSVGFAHKMCHLRHHKKKRGGN